MSTRRQFLKQTGAAAVATASGLQIAASTGCTSESSSATGAGSGSRSSMTRIKSVVRRNETILRLPGHGDVFHMTWGANDRQYVAVCDGSGWSKEPGVFYNSKLWAIQGDPPQPTFENVPGYPEKSLWDVFDKIATEYYGFGTLAVDGRIYQFLCTQSLPPVETRVFIGAKFIYSPDNGRTWCNQDGSTPVVWESREERSRENMVFYNEPQEAFSILSFLQMGRDYGANRDGYVYVYAPNGNTEFTLNELVMFRVPKGQLLDRSAYEFFAGFGSNGDARWTHDIQGRGVVHTFPTGWYNTRGHPWAWHPSVAYNEPLGLYMMTTWGNGAGPDGLWFGKPSYLGIWVAPQPWGPWEQVHEESAWLTETNPGARPYVPMIAPKWIAKDGKSFWLVWTDYMAGSVPVPNLFANPTPESRIQAMEQVRKALPYYAFNTQRVDLVTT